MSHLPDWQKLKSPTKANVGKDVEQCLSPWLVRVRSDILLPGNSIPKNTAQGSLEKESTSMCI